MLCGLTRPKEEPPPVPPEAPHGAPPLPPTPMARSVSTHLFALFSFSFFFYHFIFAKWM
jgi:hypothetical protein